MIDRRLRWPRRGHSLRADNVPDALGHRTWRAGGFVESEHFQFGFRQIRIRSGTSARAGLLAKLSGGCARSGVLYFKNRHAFLIPEAEVTLCIASTRPQELDGYHSLHIVMKESRLQLRMEVGRDLEGQNRNDSNLAGEPRS